MEGAAEETASQKFGEGIFYGVVVQGKLKVRKLKVRKSKSLKGSRAMCTVTLNNREQINITLKPAL